MASASLFVVLPLFALTADAIWHKTLLSPNSDTSIQNVLRDGSTPGTPQVPADGHFPYAKPDREGMIWGERLLAAAKSSVKAADCGGFVSFGDFTWCAKAMPRETRAASLGLVGPRLLVDLQGQPKGDNFVGLSYGIRDRDLWSELISNRYQVPTKLYDCIYHLEAGPLGSNHSEGDFLRKEMCPYWKEGICYNAKYEVKHECMGYQKETVQGNNPPRKLQFDTLAAGLKDRPPLSTFVKMDIEGSEWDGLEQLLADDKEIDKIRSLDMEAHMKNYAHMYNHVPSDTKVMERKLRIMEQLGKKFAVVGSNIESMQKVMEDQVNRRILKLTTEPFVYTSNGYPLETYTVSYVNRKLLASAK